MKAITNLKLACYYVRHQTRTSRPSNAPLITLQRIRRLRHLRTTEAAYVEPTEKMAINDSNWPKTLESLVLWISKHLGVTKVPLGYCLRTENLAPQAPDLRYGHADSVYASHEDEMCMRSPHFENLRTAPFCSDFATDNTKVWDLIFATFKSHPAWTIIRP